MVGVEGPKSSASECPAVPALSLHRPAPLHARQEQPAERPAAPSLLPAPPCPPNHPAPRTAGKSSLLNALLEEQDILPTNGMRACTACVVEVSHSPLRHYQGTVEFMKPQQWSDTLE